MAGLAPNVIDVPLLLQNQTPPKHAGPIGRVTSMTNTLIRKFLPSSTTQPQHIQIEAREAFHSLSTQLRNAYTGSLDGSGTWANPQSLDVLGEQLVSVCSSVPRVYNGTDWSEYQYSRVLTNKLSYETIHTPNHTIQAPDSAWLNGVTCEVWTESAGPQGAPVGTSYVGFRGDNGSWVRTPSVLFSASTSATKALAKVVSDGTHFWVLFNQASGSSLVLRVYDTTGTALTSSSITNIATLSPGFWDLVYAPTTVSGTTYQIIVAEPASWTGVVSDDVHVHLVAATYNGSSITTTSGTLTTAACNGPVAWINNTTGNGLAYLATCAPGAELKVYEITTMSISHTYDGQNVGSPDSITGWVENDGAGGITCFVSYSILSNFGPSFGPPHDPGLRYVRTIKLTADGSDPVIVRQDNGVLLQSKAFKKDSDWYAWTYYQSGGGLSTQTPASIPYTVNDGDYFIGDVTQPINVAVNDLVVGTNLTATATAAVIATANAQVRIYVTATQAIASITHTAGDNLVATAQTFTFANGTFANGTTFSASTAVNSYLNIAGAANPVNNGSFRILSVTSGTVVVTESRSTAGNTMVSESFGVGVTASVSSSTAVGVTTELIGSLFPPGEAAFYIGSLVLTGAVNPANNATFTSFRALPNYIWPAWSGTPVQMTTFLCTPVGTNVSEVTSVGARIVMTPTTSNGWLLNTEVFADADVGDFLTVTGATGGNNNPAGAPFEITSLVTRQLAVTGGATGLTPEQVALPLPTITLSLADPSSAFHMHLTNITFDDSFKLAYVLISNALHPGNNGLYQITQVLGPNDVVIAPQSTTKGQRNEGFSEDLESVVISKTTNTNPAYQPCWFITPLSVGLSDSLNSTQQIAGQCEYGIAYADWRFDDDSPRVVLVLTSDHVVASTHTWTFANGNFTSADQGNQLVVALAVNANNNHTVNIVSVTSPTTIVTDGTQTNETFSSGIVQASVVTQENKYRMALTSVVPNSVGKTITLPYRAQSFTAGQVAVQVGNSAGQNLLGVQQNTVGLRKFTISDTNSQGVSNSGELLIGGMMATEFSNSGFREDSVSLGFEQPFLVGQSNDTNVLIGLTAGLTYQYVIVAEVTEENGDRILSVISPTLSVSLQGSNNTITIGGRVIGPTNRVVGIAVYRQSATNGVPTVQHYKVTNDLDVNGTGFTFSTINGGTAFDTWQFVDQLPNATILSSEVLYTDKGFIQRYPAPAFSQGVGSWENRTWVIGYDGAIWMSGAKTEGDALWFHPAFRYVLPTDDRPVALAALDGYVIVFCSNSIWSIQAAQFPDATGKNGSLPTPQPLPFRNGCTGFAETMNAGSPGAGAVYSSTAGGIWMIDRSLRNVYLSQPMQDDLQLGVSGLTVDGQQRLIVATNSTNVFVYDQLPQAWYKWNVPTVAQLVTTLNGKAVYQDNSYVSVYTPGQYADMVPSATGIAPDVTLALSEFGNIRGLKSVWACNIVGEYKGYHRLNAVMSYPDETDQPDTTFGPFTPDPTKPYVLEINPMVEEASSFGVRVYVDFVGAPNTPGNSMTLELLSFEVGLEPTLNKVPAAQQIKGR